MGGGERVISCFENDGLQRKKSHHFLSGSKKRQFKQTKDCVAALSMMASIVCGSL